MDGRDDGTATSDSSEDAFLMFHMISDNIRILLQQSGHTNKTTQ